MNKNKILERKEIHVKFSVTKDCGHIFLKSVLLLLLLLSRFSRVRLWRPHRRQPTRLPHPWDSPGKNTDGSPPGSSVPGILQARTLEWVAMSFSSA